MNWKTIPGPTEDYQISEDGCVRSMKTGDWVMMKTRINKAGYHTACLSYFGVSQKRLVHRLIASAFIPNPENKPQINHKNGVKTDNRIENLEWVSSRENTVHSVENGLRKYPKSKYTDEQIQEVFRQRALGLSQEKIAEITGISQSMVCFFLLGYRTKFKSILKMRAVIGKKRFCGESHPGAVLTEENVREIRLSLKKGVSAFQCAKNYSVSYPTIWSIKNWKTWKHVY